MSGSILIKIWTQFMAFNNNSSSRSSNNNNNNNNNNNDNNNNNTINHIISKCRKLAQKECKHKNGKEGNSKLLETIKTIRIRIKNQWHMQKPKSDSEKYKKKILVWNFPIIIRKYKSIQETYCYLIFSDCRDRPEYWEESWRLEEICCHSDPS